MVVEPAERRRIAKAIWVYDGRDQRAFAKAAGITYPRFRAALADTKPPPTVEELLAMAEAASVPREFALDGWAGWHDIDRVAALEQRIARLEAARDGDDLDAVREIVRDILSEGPSDTSANETAQRRRRAS